MHNLIKADLYKETHKKSFIFTILLIIIASTIYTIFACKNISAKVINIYPVLSESDYIKANKYGNYSMYIDSYNTYATYIQNVNISSEYYLSSKVRILFYLLGLIIIIKAFHSLSYDYQNKTIRYLFISGHKRKDILISKYISILILTLLFMLLIFSITSIIMFIQFGNLSFIINHLLKSLLYILPILCITILTMLLCILFNGSNIALVISIIIYICSLTLSSLAISYGFNIVTYTFMPYLDYTYFEEMDEVLINNAILNTNFSYFNGFILLTIYSIIFILISNIIIKKDV